MAESPKMLLDLPDGKSLEISDKDLVSADCQMSPRFLIADLQAIDFAVFVAL